MPRALECDQSSCGQLGYARATFERCDPVRVPVDHQHLRLNGAAERLGPRPPVVGQAALREEENLRRGVQAPGNGVLDLLGRVWFIVEL